MVKFSEIKYVRPDLEQYKKDATALLDRIENAKSYAEMKQAYLEFDKRQGELNEACTVAYIRNTVNKSDEFYDAEIKFIDEQTPTLMPISKRMSQLLLSSPFRKEFEAEYGTIINESCEKNLPLQDERLIPDMQRENELTQEYSLIAAKCKTIFRGEECNLYGLLKHMNSTDRVERKEAFIEWSKLYEGVSGELDRIYSELVEIRHRKATTVGMNNYHDFALISSDHFDYTKEDLANFKKQVVEVIVPIAAKLFEEQKERLGIDVLNWYDEGLIYPEGNATPQGNKDQMISWANEMYHELSAETGEFFDFMCKYELFDLETKPNKHLGGYMTLLDVCKAPFIFSNFNGTSADVDVLTHEAGHAFQGYVGSRTQPVSALYASTSDIDEIHSMTMEHLTYPWMDKFFGENVDKFRYAHLSESIKVIPYLCAVDEFQCRVYDKPQMTAEERYQAWHDIETVYLPWRKYDGNAFLEKGGFWMQKQHIFLYPFYYIDYALAQICAHQLFAKVCENKEEGWNDYLRLCKAGGQTGYLGLLKIAGVKSPFEDGTVKETMDKIEKQLEIFKSKLDK
ncbi:MAG: M3 family oligoendopeptidase [Lachnospiraceae bacterium]|nr:M3 family oligoendopeptidase [Lachnospiraceae bacterium]